MSKWVNILREIKFLFYVTGLFLSMLKSLLDDDESRLHQA
jgi:hypothetical protein